MTQDTQRLTVEAIKELLERARKSVEAEGAVEASNIRSQFVAQIIGSDEAMPLDDNARERLRRIESTFVAYCQDGDIQVGAQVIYDLIHLPITVTDDPRVGCKATDDNGLTGIVEWIHRFPDGKEYISIYNEATGIGHGGMEPHQVHIELSTEQKPL